MQLPYLCRICHVLSAGNPDFGTRRLITDEIIEYVLYAKEKGCSMQGTEDPAVEYLNVL